MRKYPFSGPGAAAWHADLQHLTPAALQEEADYAGTAFSSWLKTRFELDSSQQDYLDGIDPALLTVWGAEVSYAIISGMAIALIKPDTVPGTLRGSKLIVSEDEKRTPRDGSGREAGSAGYLTFTIRYQ